ncbi:uncharacterized protein LOC130897115 isoform X1 [Diorhabda carinulata]|uniref:uncharacterized protein LOC130897115 isoform X1 n=2 Tax=Diorhabda carinulata TaxID=1163345 RepID=UPI0025A15370|nr:uncharacterized protein LOC130897115 isoform X1 [Diorhabda carinulata]
MVNVIEDLQFSTEYAADEENHIFYKHSDIDYEERGLGYHFYKYMQQHSNLVAQYIADKEQEDTYHQVLERCIRTALHLSSRNLTRDDIIVICSTNNQFTVVPFIASLFLNVPVATLDPTLSCLDFDYLLKEVKPKVIFIIPEVVEMVETSLQNAGIITEIILIGKSDVYTEFSSFLEPHPDEETFEPKLVENVFDTAVILFSSGTTGLPKGIMISHYALMAQAAVTILSNNINKIYLSYASLYWITRVMFLVATYQIGAANVMVSKFDPQECWLLLDKYKVTNLFLPPSGAISLIKAGRPDNIDTSNLLTFVTGGAILPQEYILELRDLLPGAFIYQAYGQTEISGAGNWFDVNDVKQILYLHNKPNSVGLPIPNVMCKVVNVDTEKTCGPNEQGELRFKSKMIMNGFFNRDCSDSFDTNGWLKTGDVCYYDEDGCFYIVDRIKEMLKYKSWHVAPAMLEKILVNHPAVSQVVVIGKPHDEDGDHPMAVIIPNESYLEVIDEDDVINFVEERVPDRMKLRGGIKIVNSFPMTPSGKIKRVLLKKMILNGEI